MVMNVKMEARTWEQLLFILLQITQLTLPETPPRKREDTLGKRSQSWSYSKLVQKQRSYVSCSSKVILLK